MGRLIGQNLTGEFMQKIHTASWNLFTLTAEADRVFCQLVMFFTVFFHWMHMDAYLLFMAGLFIEFFVEKCAACQSWKSGFGWHRFRFTPSCWMRVEKSLNSWYLSGPSTASRIVSLSNYCIKCMCLFFLYIYLISWGRAQVMRLVYARLRLY